MKLICESGKTLEIDSAASVIVPIGKKPGDSFDVTYEDWESDRAWCIPKGVLIVVGGIVERISKKE